MVTVSSESLSVLTDGTLKVDCIVVGKPLVDKSSVMWTHETITSLNLTQFVNTVKGSADDYTLNSTLIIPNPPKNYSGVFKCNVRDQSKPVRVSIHCEFVSSEILLTFLKSCTDLDYSFIKLFIFAHLVHHLGLANGCSCYANCSPQEFPI